MIRRVVTEPDPETAFLSEWERTGCLPYSLSSGTATDLTEEWRWRRISTDSVALSDRFLASLEAHVSRLTVRGRKATGLCPLHADRSPSFAPISRSRSGTASPAHVVEASRTLP
jgi:hypothetical protein